MLRFGRNYRAYDLLERHAWLQGYSLKTGCSSTGLCGAETASETPLWDALVPEFTRGVFGHVLDAESKKRPPGRSSTTCSASRVGAAPCSIST